MSTRNRKPPPPVEPDLPALDPASQTSIDNALAEVDANYVPPMADEYMDTAPEEVINGLDEPEEIRRAEPVPQGSTGTRFDFSAFSPIVAAMEAGDTETARKLKEQLSPVQQHVLERASYTDEYTAEKAAEDASAFMDLQQRQKMARESPTGRAAQEKSLVDSEKRMMALDEIKSVRKMITEMVGDGEKIPPHPGFSGSVGLKNYAYGFGLIPEFLGGDRPFGGTEEANFYPYLKQLEGGAFLRAFERIRGGGQITEIEGQKATDAIIRASSSQSEDGFKKSMKDFLDVVTSVEGRMLETEAKRGGSPAAGAQPAAGQPAPARPAYQVGKSYRDNQGRVGIFTGYNPDGSPAFSRPSR